MKRTRLIGLVALAFLVLLVPTSLGILLIHEPDALEDAPGVTNAEGKEEKSRLDVMRGGVPFALANGETVEVNDNLLVNISVNPFPPDDFDCKLKLHITTVDGTPVENAEISMYYDMLYMFHGWSESPVENLGNGDYQIDFDFFMFGAWTLDTYIELADEQGEASLPLVLYVWPA